MTLALPDVADISQAEVDAMQTELYELLSEAFPQVDLTRGYVHDVNLHMGAVINAMLRKVVDRVASSQSLLLINQDPELADTEVVDQLLSNFNIARKAGTAASGQVVVVVDAQVPVVIPSGTTFAASGVSFATTQAYSIRISQPNVTAATDRVLTPIGGGSYSFTVPVVASTVGVAGMIRRGAAMTPSFSIPHYVQSYAESDFTGGVDAEDNASLVARLQQGIAARTFSNRGNVDALVHQNPDFAQVMQLSIVGAGDVEMLRDKHTIFPLASFGRADVYARTAALPASITVTKSATYVGVAPGGAGGVWQFSMAKDEVPGFYEVTRVAPTSAQPNDAGFAVQDDIRGFDISGDGWRPDIVSAVEAAYSPFQTATIRFVDTATALAGLVANSSTATYSVSAAAMPQLAELQDFLGGRAVRAYGGDVLVKAPMPCFLRVSFEVLKPSLAADPDVAAMRAAVASTVNNLGFPGRIHASTISGAVRDLLPPGAALGPVDVFGRVRRPDGTTTFLRDRFSNVIDAPDEPGVMITARTLAFILDPADVAVAVRVVEVPDI